MTKFMKSTSYLIILQGLNIETRFNKVVLFEEFVLRIQIRGCVENSIQSI